MYQVISTDDYPNTDRFDAWVEHVGRALAPVDIEAAEPRMYRGRMFAARYGSVGVASVTSSSCTSRRTRRRIEQSDPGAVQLIQVTAGTVGIKQNGVMSQLRPGDLAVHHTWRLSTVHAMADDSGTVIGNTAVIPRHQITLTDNVLDRVAARPFSGRAAEGALLANFLRGMLTELVMPPHSEARVGQALADLLTIALSAAARLTSPRPEAVRGTLLIAVLDYVKRHLDDHRLNAASVAAAHHVSTRTLNRIFENHGETISAFIRRCRFDRCMHDLADPALCHRPIQDIITRWCFRSQTHFNRRFRETTGMTPGEYRFAALRAAARE